LSSAGFPNTFWGWGGEDDAMYDRAVAAGLAAARASKGHFVLLEHAPATGATRNATKRACVLANAGGAWRADGLCSMRHELVGERRLSARVVHFQVTVPDEEFWH
jgi:hypothetical protein